MNKQIIKYLENFPSSDGKITEATYNRVCRLLDHCYAGMVICGLAAVIWAIIVLNLVLDKNSNFIPNLFIEFIMNILWIWLLSKVRFYCKIVNYYLQQN